jgi:BirA family biotin operon repressor/biotin-[acetyl-CoA-carboxylase] ligase
MSHGMLPDRLQPIPQCAVVGRKVHHLDEVGSTNDEALREGTDGTVIVAERQRAGRGRHGRAWHSAPGLGLWMSVVFTQPVPGLPFGAALALRDALAPFAPVTIKWPNDILSNGKKLCGVLLESRDNRTVLGIGINVLHRLEDLPSDLHPTATSLLLASRAALDRPSVFEAVIVSLDRRVVQLRSGAFDAVFEEWAAACGVIGRRVRHEGATGEVVAIEPSGALRLQTDSGPHAVVYGDTIEME